MIVIIGPAHPYRGGIADTNESLAQALIEQGQDVEIFSFSRLYPSWLFPGKTQFSSKEKPEEIDIVRCIDSIGPNSWRKTAKAINKMAPSLVIFRYWSPFLGPCLGTIARLIKTKCVTIVDNAISHEPKFGESFFLRYMLAAQDGVISLSHHTSKQLNFIKSKTCLTYPHPINKGLAPMIEKEKARSILGLDHNSPVVLFFGLIRKYKGVGLLIEAISQLKNQIPDLRVLIVGEPYIPISPYLKKTKELGVEEMISFHTSYVEDKDVGVWFSACDCVVQPYQAASQSGITPMALYYQRPMVVTDVGGLSEGLDMPVAKIVSPYARSIAAGLETILKADPPSRKDFAAHRDQRSWRNFSQKVLTFAQSL
jgi:glycosyltransferase involved in cell wall biosynthesis